MSNHEALVPRPPMVVRWMDPLVRRWLARGMPMSSNTLLTVRGRTSGEPRSVGIATVEIGERVWVVGAYGDVHWVRNLRAAGEAEIRLQGRPRRVVAQEYDAGEAVAWIRDVLTPHIRSLPLVNRLAASFFARKILADPEAASMEYPVFELRPMPWGDRLDARGLPEADGSDPVSTGQGPQRAAPADQRDRARHSGPQVGWDEDKAEANRRKHGIDFFEAMEAMLDPLAVTIEDGRHTTPAERRVTVVGMSRRQRLIRVAVAERGTIIRIISARRATARERYEYEEG